MKKVFDVFGENSVNLRLFRSDSLKGGDVVKDFYDILKLNLILWFPYSEIVLST